MIYSEVNLRSMLFWNAGVGLVLVDNSHRKTSLHYVLD